MSRPPITLTLCGDVMTGRGIDQILQSPSDPTLHEAVVKDAREYVRLAERLNGPIPRKVAPAYVWGDAAHARRALRPDVVIVNLETAITTTAAPWPKGINYRMHPRNVGVLTAFGVDGCVLANNHVLDWGEPGLVETLAVLRQAGITTAGAGLTDAEASQPAIVPVDDASRVLLFAYAHPSSGVPREWSATAAEPGVQWLPDLSAESVVRVRTAIAKWKRPNDVVVISIHWGPNWGYEIPAEQADFAHGLIETAGAHVIFGHSSHHPKAIERYRGRLIFYGCGDFLNDYEGVRGEEAYRPDLTLMYAVTVRSADGSLVSLRAVPFQIRRFRLEFASQSDQQRLCDMLNREGKQRDTRFRPARDALGSIEMG